MNLKPVFLDYESFWSVDHSLSKMNPIAYVMHPETEIISVAAKFGSGNTDVVFGEDRIKLAMSKIDWSNKYVIAHNNEGFDSMISAWRMGIRPAMWGCTLAMARPHHAKTAGGSLKALVAYYAEELTAMGISAVKDQTALVNTKGRHLADFSLEEIEAMRVYNKTDTEQCAGLFKILLQKTSRDELRLIDMTIRMLVEPQFEADVPMLVRALREEKERKRSMLLHVAAMLGVDGLDDDEIAENVSKVLSSSHKFAEFLESKGIDPPMKPSPTNPEKTTYALAKTDEEFTALQDHPDGDVAAATRARLGVKSTILETRLEAFIEAAGAANGFLPVPLKYYGADTTGRWSGWGYNPQNLPRVSGKPSDALRMSLRAPKGHKVVVADLSGIELRVNLMLWKVPYAMELYAQDPEADLYKPLASEVLGVPIDQIVKMQRQAGKAMHLGCGFGLGSTAKYVAVAKQMAQIVVTEDEAAVHIAGYRRKHPEVVQGWKTCHAALPAIAQGARFDIDPWGLCYTSKEGIVTPKGIIRYPNLRQEHKDGKTEWVYGEGRNKARIYAGKVTENCLAEGTLVLTDSGWRPIETVTEYDRVHDGDNFVRHAGSVCKSVQPCVNIDGVYMTADHEVLDEHGNWKEASQLPRPYRPAIRGTDRLTSFSHRREEMVLGIQVPVRSLDYEVRAGRDQGHKTWRDPELRVLDEATYIQGKHNPRYDKASGLRGMAQHARPVSTSIAQSMEKLRRAWDNGMRSMAGIFRELLGGHGPVVPAGYGFGSPGQQRSVFARELSVGSASSKYAEQAELAGGRHSNHSEGDGDSKVNTVLSAETRAAAYRVYDILNAGPQHRFVVLGENGPFIVHNCVQHLARCIIADNALEVKKRTGFSPALMVHDELAYVVPEEEAGETLGVVQSIMRTPPAWWPELITWSEGDIADTYGAAK